MTCASCGQRPAQDNTVMLIRVNVKGVPGVFLCQWCLPNPEPITSDPVVIGHCDGCGEAAQLKTRILQLEKENLSLRETLGLLATDVAVKLGEVAQAAIKRLQPWRNNPLAFHFPGDYTIREEAIGYGDHQGTP